MVLCNFHNANIPHAIHKDFMDINLFFSMALVVSSIHFLPTLTNKTASNVSFTIFLKIGNTKHKVSVVSLSDALTKTKDITQYPVHLVIGRNSFSENVDTEKLNHTFCTLSRNKEVLVLKK